MSKVWPWLVLFGLGAYHGINPAMGWLFAVALGLQEKSRRAVLHAIPPIALGHAISIGMVVSLLWLARVSVPQRNLRYGAAAILFGFAVYRLARARHPKWVGMRVGFRDLTLWSFLMASAHGAGLMLVPVLLAWPAAIAVGPAVPPYAIMHMSHMGQPALFHLTGSESSLQWPAAVGVHTVGYLSVAALVALLVYEKLGVAILRRAWFNLDLVWMVALMLSGILILLV
jgi:hypothetical protein